MSGIEEDLNTKTKEEIARERKKIYQRNYMRNRRQTDPEFAKKQREYHNAYVEREENNTKYREYNKNYCKNYYLTKKQELKELKELVKGPST